MLVGVCVYTRHRTINSALSGKANLATPTGQTKDQTGKQNEASGTAKKENGALRMQGRLFMQL